MYCFRCCFPTDHYLEGILVDHINVIKEKRKRPVVYMCDLCKQLRFFKYSAAHPPVFTPIKYRFSGDASVYSAPREYPMHNCFMQTRYFVFCELEK